MNTILQTEVFKSWLKSVKDPKAKAAVLNRIERAKAGNFGDHKSVGGSVFEMRIDTGQGYRVYYVRNGNTVYVLLAGGTKNGQQKDIDKAQELAGQL